MNTSSHSAFRSSVCLTFISLVSILTACSGSSSVGEEKDDGYNRKLVINELMTNNQTTIIKDGDTPKWIEIKNISTDAISLNEYSLMAGKVEDASAKDSLAKEKSKDSIDNKKEQWFFPDCKLEAGEILLVYLGKKDKKKGGMIVSDIKLPSKDGYLKLLAPNGNILSETDFSKLDADQSLARLEDGDMVKCKQPTPGFDNTDEGFEAFMAQWDANSKGDVKIWEIKGNGSALTGQWIELKNTSSSSVNLKDYAVTNKANKPDRCPLPDITLAPGAFYLVKTVGRSNAGARKDVANFKLGENNIAILTKKGKIVDAMNANGCIMGTSRGRIDGQKGIFYFASPTMSAENTTKGYRTVVPMPTTDKAPGIYADKKTLTVAIDGHGHKVHYTLDGTEPTTASPVYNQPLTLAKTTTIRYFAEGTEKAMRSGVNTDTYMLGQKQSLAVVQVTIRKQDLYDPATGIYVEGNRAPKTLTIGKNSENLNANYMQKWAKLAHVEFFDGKEGFEVDCAMKIFGAGSRMLEKKSFSLKFDSEYGASSVTYDFFNTGKPVELEDIVLRSGTNDNYGVMVRDEFFESLMAAESPTLLTQAYRPVALYLNDEYYGIYFFREKIDNKFVARHLGVSDDDIKIMRSQSAERGTGAKAEFDSLNEYVRTHDMTTPEAYKYMDSRIDFLSLIDQKLGQMYSANTDIYNVRQVKSCDKDCDQKWYWVLYDLDNSFETFKPMAFYLRAGYTKGIGGQPVAYNNVIIDRMLANKQFRKLFLERVSHHMHHTFKPEHAISHFDSMIKTVEPEIARNCDRWHMTTYKGWQNNVTRFKGILQTRWKTVLDDLRNEIGITSQEESKYFRDL